MRIMVGDDDASVRGLVRAALESEMDVVEAADGMAALTELRTEHVDLVVLDIMMPALDGFEVLSRIRGSDRLVQTPVIMLSGRVREADHVRAFKSGADGYLTKPFEVEQLADLVRRLATSSAADRVQTRREELGRAELLRQIEQRFAS